MSSTALPPSQGRLRHGSGLRRREIFWFYVFISPWIIGFLIFQAGPIIAAAYFSFTDLTDLNLNNPPHWVGFIHYKQLFTSLAFQRFRDGIRASAIYVFVGVPARLIVALPIAQLLNQRIPFLRVLRTIYYMPTVVAGVAAPRLRSRQAARWRRRSPITCPAVYPSGRRSG
jgi:multiple sugar transport system permease protein